MILVTGGTGFLGRDLVPELAKLDDVRLVSRKRQAHYDTAVGDIADPAFVRKAMKGVDTVFHLAKFKGHNYPYKKHYATTVLGTKNMVDAAKQEGVGRFIYMSTAAVRNMNVTPYARAKAEAEAIVRASWKELDAPIIRCSLIYDKAMILRLSKFFKWPIVPCNRKQKLHLSYKGSVIQALVGAMKYGKSDIYEVGDRKPVLFTDFYQELARPVPVLFLPYPFVWPVIAAGYPVEAVCNAIDAKPPFTPTYIRYLFESRVMDIAKAVKTLRYRPVDTLETVRRLKKP